MLDQLARPSGYDFNGPFLNPSVNSNAQFMPPKTSSFAGPSSVTRVPKPPKPPEKPVMPYMRYSRKVWDSVKATNPDLKLWEMGKVIGQMWRETNANERQLFIDEYETEKEEYAEAYRSYQNSPAYQHYLIVKERAAQEEREAKARAALELKTVHSRLPIPPCELDDEDFEYYSVRQLSGARYQRNHKLMLEVFSDSVMPDTRSVVTTQRLQGWKRQVETLISHQRKLEAELVDLENKFLSKKRQIEDRSKDFQDAVNKKPLLDDALFSNLVASEEKKLLSQYQWYLQKVEQFRQNGNVSTPEPSLISSGKIDLERFPDGDDGRLLVNGNFFNDSTGSMENLERTDLFDKSYMSNISDDSVN